MQNYSFSCIFPCLTHPLLSGNSWNHSQGGFLFFVLLHPLSCSFAILTCPLLTALTQKTKIINEFGLRLEETRNSQERLSSLKLTQWGPARTGFLWQASWLLPQTACLHFLLTRLLWTLRQACRCTVRDPAEHLLGNTSRRLGRISQYSKPGHRGSAAFSGQPLCNGISPTLLCPLSCLNFLLPPFSIWPTILYFVFQLLSPVEGRFVGTGTSLLHITGAPVPKKGGLEPHRCPVMFVE